MKTQLQSMIDTALKLEPIEQMELIQAVSQSLPHNQLSTVNFWQPKTLEEIVQTQPTHPVTNIADLGADFWPEDESADDIIEYLYQQRREERFT